MMRNLLSSVLLTLFGASALFSQTSLKVTLTDKANKEPIPFANVVVLSGSTQIAVGTTDINGEVVIKPLTPGKYDVKATYVGYKTIEIAGFIVAEGKTNYAVLEMSTGQVDLSTVEVIEYAEPLIDPDTKSGGTVTREEYQNMPSKNINSVAATTAGVYQSDEGGALNVRGTRSSATDYYVDGQKVVGSAAVPQQAVEQISTITGGLPAQYGDATGGIISITTRGPASDFFGGVEVITSGAGEGKGLDAYGYNFVGFSIGGPILSQKDEASGLKKSKLGFIVSGEGFQEDDSDPSAVGIYVVKPELLKSLEEQPFSLSPSGVGLIKNAEKLHMEDLDHVKAKPNSRYRTGRLNAKLDFKPTDNLVITLGGSVNYRKGHNFDFTYSLLNPVNNARATEITWRGFTKITQKFGTQAAKGDEKSSSNIKNAYYSLQVGYEKFSSLTEDDTHEDNLFDYGYVGKFQQFKVPTYLSDTVGPDTKTQSGWRDSLLVFSPGGRNLTTENYTESYYSFTGASKVINGTQVQAGLGLLNGDRPGNIYGLFYNTGRQYNGYGYGETNQFRVTTSFSADIKNHAVQIGFDYEQRTSRNFNVGPIGLWTLMRQLTNFHLAQMDTANPIVSTQGTWTVYNYNRKYDASSQRQFDKNLRKKLGLAENNVSWLDIDAMDPNSFTLDMFTPDELLNSGNSYVGFYGYDHTGKKLTGSPTVDDFFNKKDANGNFTREVGAFQPIYIAGYIQDKFDFRDLKFNVGVRIDRFDANQPVLKDKYLLYEAKTKGEIKSIKGSPVTHPSNIGDDYIVYVDDLTNPGKILGYRDGEKWYNAEGVEVADPLVEIAQKTVTGTIQPYLVDPNKQELSSKSFNDYEPQLTIMPRIAFSFPISDMANFFAHYDVLTQRPSSNSRIDLISLLYLPTNQGAIINNPDLKPERTTDYELGFSQVLNERKNSALTLSAFYRELRDMIQITNVNQAYPVTYSTYGNIDFGTVKGFSIAYDLRRTSNVSLNASYTMQFADGTGSSAADGVNIISSGLPNLRTTVPLDFDQRHRIVANVDYRFASGKEYNGPVIKDMKIFQDAGINFVFNAGSGVPYSKQSNITQAAAFGINQRSYLKGSIKGSRLPWTYRIDLRVDKGFDLELGKSEEGKKPANLNVYLQILNVLDTRNVVGVYRATGNPDDDGYLANAASQGAINGRTDPESFRELYRIKLNNPNNYSIPRRIRLGVIFSF